MKNLILLLSFTSVALFLGLYMVWPDKSQLVNPILGDISYMSKFGHKPDETTDNTLRIRTHLEYVENLLRGKDVSELSLELQTQRNHLLDLLHAYWTNGLFPKNYDYSTQRKPCFIDKDGTICAVGYLVEKTAGRQVAHLINSQYKYENLLAMHDATLDEWVLRSGLTKEEFAMIQPTYGPTPTPTTTSTPNHISASYGISSSLLIGLNLSLITVNGVQMGKGTSSGVAPIIGLFTGAGQIVYGSAMFPTEKSTTGGFNYSNESQKTLSMVNIGIGTSTLILSAWNLITNTKFKDKKTSWNIYSFPTQDNNAGVAFSFSRKF